MTKPPDPLPLAEVLRAVDASGPDAWEHLCAIHPPKRVYTKLEDLIGRAYLECGVSPRRPWLTDKGRRALAARGSDGE